MLQDSLNLLRSQYLGLNRILSTLSELVSSTVQSKDEAAIVEYALQLLLHNHNFEYSAVYLNEDDQVVLIQSSTIQSLLRGDDVDPQKSKWAPICDDLCQQHSKCPDVGLIKHEIDHSFYYSIPMRFEQQQLGFILLCAPSYNDNHEKFLPMFANALMSLLMNKQQQARLARDVERRSEELESAWDVAAKSNTAKTMFLSSISHEYLTPLNVINNAGSLLMESGLNSEQLDSVTTIVESVEELRNKIDHSIDFVHSETAILGNIQRGICLIELVNEVVSEQKENRGELSAIEVRVLIDEIPSVDVDGDRVRQVLQRLVGNALKFTDAGVVEVSVKLLRGEGRLATVEFRVSDTGVGIAPADQGDIFSAFPQVTRAAHLGRGSGLGLALCQRLVRSLGGEISVMSALGQGSTFHFTLELAVSDQTDWITQETESALSEKLSVLLVEDNLVNQKLAARLLENMGCDVDVASDGVDAVDKFSQATYDVVFMDCQMPNMDGFEATSRIRQLESESRTPIIALTANSLPEDRVRSFSAGMDEFLTKPIAKEQLKQALYRWSS